MLHSKQLHLVLKFQANMLFGLAAAAMYKDKENEKKQRIKSFLSLEGQVDRQLYYLCDNGSSRDSLNSTVIEIADR